MSNFNLPDFIIQTFTKGLETYANILSKTQEYAKANNIDVNTFVQARLVEDQLPLAFQVQNTSKAVLANLGRLGGPEPTVFENNETTFEDLQKRIAKTLEFVKSFDAEAVKGKEDEEIEAYVPPSPQVSAARVSC